MIAVIALLLPAILMLISRGQDQFSYGFYSNKREIRLTVYVKVPNFASVFNTHTFFSIKMHAGLQVVDPTKALVFIISLVWSSFIKGNYNFELGTAICYM